jgi:hypothetical protein
MRSKWIALAGLTGLWFGLCGASYLATPPSNESCEARENGSQPRLVECIRRDALWRHLAAFQKIADENPGRAGHGNRDTGTSGYKASVDYVAGWMRRAGYRVTVQPYNWRHSDIVGAPIFEAGTHAYALARDWFVASGSGSGALTAPVQPVSATVEGEPATGCAQDDFAGFVRGHVALARRGACDYDTQVANAEAAGASALIIYNYYGRDAGRSHDDGGAFEAHLDRSAKIPVLGVVSHAVGAELSRAYETGESPATRLDIRTRTKSDIDYNVIADSPFGDPDHIVVVDAHLDSIYGAGMLDNASGSATILELALKLAHTQTRNRLRYIWFGGEEIGLLGSHYYTRNLLPKELRRIVFDVDVDVTATPNFVIFVADPAHAGDAKRFPPNVIPRSRIGNHDFIDYFRSIGMVAWNANNDGTDSNSFSLVGVPNSGIYTQQDCCKRPWEVKLWGGYLGDFEGEVPGWHGYCVDRPGHWCDNLSNNDPFVLEFVSKAVAAVTLELANDGSLRHGEIRGAR